MPSTGEARNFNLMRAGEWKGRCERPTFGNMPTVRLMLKGASLADVPLVQASIAPCYSCTDR